ncbi:MAG: hypothetical protein RLO03_05050 [Balneola sp.]
MGIKIVRDTPRAGPEGPACLKSHNKIYTSRAFTPGGYLQAVLLAFDLEFPAAYVRDPDCFRGTCH